MSLTVCVTTPEGIVMAADSRQTYRNNVGAARIGSDSATKIFPIGDKFGVTVAGPAFLVDPDEPNASPRSIAYFINRFINQLSKRFLKMFSRPSQNLYNELGFQSNHVQ